MNQPQKIFGWIAMSLAAIFLFACDGPKIKALQTETAQLAATVAQQNDDLLKVNQMLVNCHADLDKLKKKKSDFKAEVVTVEPPVAGEASVKALESYKTALNETIEKQKVKLVELNGANEACMKDLEAAQAKKVVKKAPAKKTTKKKTTTKKRTRK